MEEARFVLWFNVYTGDGLPVNFTVRAETFDDLRSQLGQVDRAYPQLGGFSTLLKDAPEGAVKPAEYRIIGWARGSTKDARSGKQQPCVYLYSDLPHLDMKVCSVYHEDLYKLPPTVNWQSARDMGDQALLISRGAKTSPAWHDCDFRIILMPIFDYEGNVVMNAKGNKPKMRFSSVIGYDPEPPTAQEPAAQAASTSTPAQTAKPAAQAQQPVAKSASINQGDGPCPVCHAPAGKPHAAKCTNQGGRGDQTAKGVSYSVYATALHDGGLAVSKDVFELARRVRSGDKESQGRMSVTVGDKKGQHNFLIGLIDNITGTGNHKEILSILAGRDIDHGSPLGDGCRFLLDELWPGKKDQPNEKYSAKTVATIKGITALVGQIDSAQRDAAHEEDDRYFDPVEDTPF